MHSQLAWESWKSRLKVSYEDLKIAAEDAKQTWRDRGTEAAVENVKRGLNMKYTVATSDYLDDIEKTWGELSMEEVKDMLAEVDKSFERKAVMFKKFDYSEVNAAELQEKRQAQRESQMTNTTASGLPRRNPPRRAADGRFLPRSPGRSNPSHWDFR